MKISILIPTYNDECLQLVTDLQRQCEQETAGRLDGYEIIAGDDGSTDSAVVQRNRLIDSLPHCRYITGRANRGRAAIRNFMAQTAQYEFLLFADADMMLRNHSYISNYTRLLAGMEDRLKRGEPFVVYGGYSIPEPTSDLMHNLRYRYESLYDGNHTASLRRLNPYHDFHTSNFIVPRETMLRLPLDERFRHYGYEDVLWGKQLKAQGVDIIHTDNTLSFEIFESNEAFLRKTAEGVRTLCRMRQDLKGYSSLITLGDAVRRCHLTMPLLLLQKAVQKPIKHNLTSNKPSLFLFKIYKALTMIDVMHRQGSARDSE